MRQVLIIHGGSSFDTYQNYIEDLKNSSIDYERLKKSTRWSDWLATVLPDADILTPRFPNAHNAVYNEWKIYFEKILPFLNTDASLVGHSLGAMFLAKYLNENPLPQPIGQLILLAGCYDDDSLEELGSFTVNSAKNLERSAKEIHLLHSRDDPVVPFTELAKFQADLPHATSHVFDERGHFLTSEFPELLYILKQK